MKPEYELAKETACEELASGDVPEYRNLAACYLELRDQVGELISAKERAEDLISTLKTRHQIVADILAALQVFVDAHEEWALQMERLPIGSFDDPLDAAYKIAIIAIEKATGKI